jgi:two-component system response regulator PrrA
MVVADDADVLTSLERGLRLSGFDMSSAKDSDEALSFVRQAPADAVVIAINSPVLRGIDVVTALRAVDNIVPVCVLSERSSEDDKVPWLKAGADDCLFKPFSLSELVTRLRALLRRSRPAVVDAFISNLRRKLDAADAPRLLHTVPGAGFVLRVQ